MVDRVLERTVATVWAHGAMYNLVEKLVLLYGRESWVVTRDMLKVLEGFHHRAARWIMGMTAKRGAGGEWEYPLVVESMDTVGIHPISVYIMRLQATIAEMVACRPIYELCTGAERMPGTSRLA